MVETIKKQIRQAADRKFDEFLGKMGDAWCFDEKDTVLLREIFYNGFIASIEFHLDMATVSTRRIKGAEA